jgi:hypothetical protein
MRSLHLRAELQIPKSRTSRPTVRLSLLLNSAGHGGWRSNKWNSRLNGHCSRARFAYDISRRGFQSYPHIVQRLDLVMKNLETEVEKMPEEKLTKVAPSISHISTHNAYHTGQILYVRKLQGSWNPANGVK